ncbi:hypothetical protein AOZ06_26730 [Kibdelosporangium phytohabitans]|uniref:Carboxylic ester hydrolase n=1 Tax=Kibdelosporangium phytohabitans TaxID=860235 RepID=A0A0N7F3Z6_9PSEU|nr:carboxylesterase family protein [Kibdelosporangium phytohabitans]ALG10015.1 hypothetical protein AOZ06_26730 [Kibdelosporangium phytohabitans]
MAVLALVTAAPAALAATDPAVVRTTDGPVRGTVTGHYRQFQGIPYAAPPIGDRRWQPPAAVTPWTEVRDATKPGNACPQRTTEDIGNEDCLYLNVSTPATVGHRPRPVMVWLHGGGFLGGSGSEYVGNQLAERGDVVVVSINYRLGALGYLSLPNLSGGGTFGLQDQQAALRWARANARAFGGDPGNVTLFGESAGGLSVCAQLTSPTARDLFQKAIVQSGPCELKWRDSEFLPDVPAGSNWTPRADADKTGTALAVSLGCTGDTLACLRNASVSTLLDSQIGQPAYGTPVLPLHPAEAVGKGRIAKVPVITGITRDEHRGFTPFLSEPITATKYEQLLHTAYGDKAAQVLKEYPVSAYSSPTIAWAAVATDSIWARTQHDVVEQLVRQVPTFTYEFRDRTAPAPPPSIPDMGAYHGSELSYLFPGAMPVELNAAQRALGERMQRYWANFAHTGQPNGHGLPYWRANQSGDRTVHGLDIAPAGIGRVDSAAEHKLAFWNGLVSR